VNKAVTCYSVFIWLRFLFASHISCVPVLFIIACICHGGAQTGLALHWLPIQKRVTYKLETLVHRWINGRTPEYLTEFCHPSIDDVQEWD